MRTQGMRVILLAALIALLPTVIVAAQDASDVASPVEWERGMYWTYDAVREMLPVDDPGDVREGSVTIVVLGSNTVLGVKTWVLVGIREMYEGEVLAVLRHDEFSDAYVRWPVIADLLPMYETRTSKGDLAYWAAARSLSAAGRPVRIERAGKLIGGPASEEWVADWLEPEAQAVSSLETLTLIPGEPRAVDTVFGGFPDAVPVSYTWTGFEERHSGEAFWSPDFGWWVYAEGREGEDGSSRDPQETTWTLRYDVSLSETGILSEEELTALLTRALASMEGASHPATEWVRARLKELGFDIP